MDRSGYLYVANFDGGTVLKIGQDGSQEIFLSLGIFSRPNALAFDQDGFLYVSLWADSTIMKFNPEGYGKIFASTGLFQSTGMAFDAAGNLFVANSRNGSGAGTIKKITPSGVVSNFASGLSGPRGLAFDAQGSLYAADSGLNTIVKCTCPEKPDTGSARLFS